MRLKAASAGPATAPTAMAATATVVATRRDARAARAGARRGRVLVVGGGVLAAARAGSDGDQAPAEEECGGAQGEPVALSHPVRRSAHVGDPDDSESQHVIVRDVARVGLRVRVTPGDDRAVRGTAHEPVGARLLGVVGVLDRDDLALGQGRGGHGAGDDDVTHVDPRFHRAGQDHARRPSGEEGKQRPDDEREDQGQCGTRHSDSQHPTPAQLPHHRRSRSSGGCFLRRRGALGWDADAHLRNEVSR